MVAIDAMLKSATARHPLPFFNTSFLRLDVMAANDVFNSIRIIDTEQAGSSTDAGEVAHDQVGSSTDGLVAHGEERNADSSEVEDDVEEHTIFVKCDKTDITRFGDSTVVTVQIEPQQSVEAIKGQLKVITGIPVSKQRIMFRGRFLETGKASTYGIGHESMLHMIVPLRGGAPAKRPRVTLADVGARPNDPPLVVECFNVRRFDPTAFVETLSLDDLRDYSAYLEKNKHVKRVTEYTVTLMSCFKSLTSARNVLDHRAAAAELWLQDLVETSISEMSLEEWRISIRQVCRTRLAEAMRT
jgi:hypothetical protein